MHKRCKDALKVTCAVALVCTLSPVTALAQSQDSTHGKSNAPAAVNKAATTDATVETDVDASKVQKTDVSKLAKVSKDAASTVKDYIADRADEVTGDKAASDDDSLDLAKKVAKTSDERADNFQQMQQDANINITDAKTSVSVSKVTESGSTVKVKAYEQTVFYYDDLSNGVGGRDVAIFGTDHTVTLDTSGKDATIKADAYDEDDLNGIDTTGKGAKASSAGAAGQSGADGSAAGEDRQASAASAVKSAIGSAAGAVKSLVNPEKAYADSASYDSDYDPKAAIAYADKYWTNYNSKYRNFNPVGGDCANFVSQSMKAGHLNQKKSGSNAWFYTSGSNYSSSWTYCPSMVQALKSRGKFYWISKSQLTTKAAAKKIYPGSPVIYNSANSQSSTGSYYHAVICTGYNSAGTPVISAHNNDRYHVPFTYAGNACATIQLTQANPEQTYTTTVSTKMNSGSKVKSVIKWRPEGKTGAVITDYAGTATSFSVPKTVKSDDGKSKTLTVTGIDSDAFAGNTSLKAVTLPSTVTSIGSSAFKGCKKLATVSGATDVAEIGSSAFSGCKKLSKLPAFGKVSSIGNYAFKNCDALKAVEGFDTVKTIGTGAFYDCDALKKVVNESKVLKSIGKRAFSAQKDEDAVGKTAAVRFDSPKLAKIGDWAFYGNTKLNTIKLKTGLLTEKTVGYSSFTRTGSKPKLYAPKKVHKTYEAAFKKHGLENFKLYDY